MHKLPSRPVTAERIREIRARIHKAPQGPWRADIDAPARPGEPPCWTGKFYAADGTWAVYDDSPRMLAAVALVESAPQDMTDLVREVERLRRLYEPQAPPVTSRPPKAARVPHKRRNRVTRTSRGAKPARSRKRA